MFQLGGRVPLHSPQHTGRAGPPGTVQPQRQQHRACETLLSMTSEEQEGRDSLPPPQGHTFGGLDHQKPLPPMGRNFVVLLWPSGQAGLSPPAARSSDPMPSTLPPVLKQGPWQAALDEEGRACSLRFPPLAHIMAGQAPGMAPGRSLWVSPPLAASCHLLLLLPTSQGLLLSLLSWLLFLPDHYTLELPGARPQAPSLPPLPLLTTDRSSSLRKQAPRGQNHLEQYLAESVLSNTIC